jgi:hypothetical protein
LHSIARSISDEMNKKIRALSILIVGLLFVSALAGTIFYYNGVVNDRDTKIESMNSQIASLNSQLSDFEGIVENLSGVVTNFTTANLVTALGATEVPKNSSHNLPSVHLYNHLYISGSVINIGKGTAYNAGLHVVAYDINGGLRINMTFPLGGGIAAFGTDARIIEYLGGSSSTVLGSLPGGETTRIDIAIFHEDTVSNWTVTPVWTNSP